MTFGAGEETSVQFDPRASQNIISPGHVNWSILGDYKQWVGGVSQTIIAGKPGTPPLIKARDTSYSVNTIIGGASVKAADAVLFAAGGNLTTTAGGISTMSAGGVMNITGGAVVNMSAVGNLILTGALIKLN